MTLNEFIAELQKLREEKSERGQYEVLGFEYEIQPNETSVNDELKYISIG